MELVAGSKENFINFVNANHRAPDIYFPPYETPYTFNNEWLVNLFLQYMFPGAYSQIDSYCYILCKNGHKMRVKNTNEFLAFNNEYYYEPKMLMKFRPDNFELKKVILKQDYVDN